ncbi:MAG: DNA polymerase Y family protein, partial [Gammaproteobacteria bacterium]|nr:DNA polymerase Y family protein [Gammaproteobacteria bacterium]
AVAIIDGEARQCRVHATNALAREHGVRNGMDLNAAYALCPALQTRLRDGHKEQQRLQRLARWAGQFTPWVSVEAPAALLLEVRGSLKLFGGAVALFERIEQGLDALQAAHRLALAPTPLAALWLARAGRRVCIEEITRLAAQLAPLPLRCLQWPQKTVRGLHGMGVRNVGDCMRLPRAGFARRFGQQRLRQLDRARGRHPDPREAFAAPERFRRALDLPAETDNTDLVLQGAGRLIVGMTQFLVQRQATVQQFRLRLFHPDQPATAIVIGMLDSGCDPLRLQSLLAVRMENTTLDAPVISLELVSGRLMRVEHNEQDLFRRSGVSAWSSLLENLCTRLGVDAVHALSSVPEHRPESAWSYDTPLAEYAAQRAPLAGRPLWLLPQPQPLSQSGHGAVTCDSGPERIESGWWDGADIARDYYVASTAAGERLWIFRDCRSPHDWYLHGIFG